MKGQPYRRSIQIVAAITAINGEFGGDTVKLRNALKTLPDYVSRGKGGGYTVVNHHGKNHMAIKRASQSAKNVKARAKK